MSDLDEVLADARRWLSTQPEPQEGSASWYGFNNLRTFIASLEADASASGLERACRALGWHISDQYGAYEELPIIAQFNDRVRLNAYTSDGDSNNSSAMTIKMVRKQNCQHSKSADHPSPPTEGEFYISSA